MKNFILGALALFAILALRSLVNRDDQISRCYESLAIPTACKYIIYGFDKPMDLSR